MDIIIRHIEMPRDILTALEWSVNEICDKMRNTVKWICRWSRTILPRTFVRFSYKCRYSLGRINTTFSKESNWRFFRWKGAQSKIPKGGTPEITRIFRYTKLEIIRPSTYLKLSLNYRMIIWYRFELRRINPWLSH